MELCVLDERIRQPTDAYSPITVKAKNRIYSMFGTAVHHESGGPPLVDFPKLP
jgi:hypothetical protein